MKLKPKNTPTKERALVYRRYTHLVDSEKMGTIYKTSDNKYWVFSGTELVFKEVATDIPTSATIINITYLQVYSYGNYYFTYYTSGGIAYWEKFTNETHTQFIFNNLPIMYFPTWQTYRAKDIPLYVGVKSGTGNITITNNSSKTIDFAVRYYQNGANSSTSVNQLGAGQTHTMFTNIATDMVLRSIQPSNHDSSKDPISLTININYEVFPFDEELPLLFPQIANIAKYQKNTYYYAGSFTFVVRGSITGATTQYIKGNIMPLTSMNIKYFNDSVNLQVDDLVVVGDHLYSAENLETDQKYQPKVYKVHFATLNNIL